MSVPDYSQSAEDHQCLLVVVKLIGTQIKSKSYHRLFERISRLQHVRIPGQQRSMWLRYRKSYTTDSNEWGDFQAHRKAMGLVCLGKCTSNSDVEALTKDYKEMKRYYSQTLFDSRCLLFGVSAEETDSVDDKDSGVGVDKNGVEELLSPSSDVVGTCLDQLDTKNDSIQDEKRGMVNEARQDSWSGVIVYPSSEHCGQLEEHLKEFACSLFWVLESKVLDRTYEKSDKLPLLMAPFEKSEGVTIDHEGRAFKKRCQGRLRKQMGDLNLMAGLPGEAISHYNAAIENLKSVNDWLWLGGALEGLCTSSAVILYPEPQKAGQLTRNSSFGGSGDLLMAASQHTRRRSGSFTSSSLPNGIDRYDYKIKNCLTPEEVIEKYKEVVLHYSKFKAAGIIETEASIKATRILIIQQKNLLASEFLKNVLFINLQLADDEKIQRYCALSQLYSQIGMERKAAFFKRVAAMQCVAPHNPNPAWAQCYHLLLETLKGYKLSLDPKDAPRGCSVGWPVIQIRLLHELVVTAKRMGNTAIAIRHMQFLLHQMNQHLTDDERKEMAVMLESYTAKAEGGPIPLVLDSGIILPPVPFTRLPIVRSFKLQNLAPHLKPHSKAKKNMPAPINKSPFIYSPIQFGSIGRSKSKIEFEWAESDVCEVTMQVYNTMPFELKVDNMSLLSEGGQLETFPSSLSLPANSGPYPVNLLSCPQGAGELKIIGYSATVLGVRSHCRLRDLPQFKQQKHMVQVAPALPKLQVQTSLAKSATFTSLADCGSIVTSGSISLYAGESQDCTLSLSNISRQPIESIELSLDCKLSKRKASKFFHWDNSRIMSVLPIEPEKSAVMNLCITAVSDFLAKEKVQTDEDASRGDLSRKNSSVSFCGPCDTYPTKTVEAILKFEYTGGAGMVGQYYRECSVSLHVEVLPSLLFTKWDVLPAEIPCMCYLVFDILNTTDHEMEIYYSDSKCVIIEADETSRIPYQVERCPLAKILKLMSNDTSIDSICRQHVADLVDIRWQSPTLETGGEASIADIPWSGSMVDMIRMSPIEWEISLNGQVCKSTEENSYRVGQPVILTVSINAYTEFFHDDITLNIQCYQDHQNGVLDYMPMDKFSIVGSRTLQISQACLKETFEHQCSLLFFCSGQFKLDVFCSSKTVQEDTSPSTIHTWKCTPVIDLGVSDD
ncbi:PREDICTED: trafficking protein particle complex subunit 9-like isoform X2 [Priapulus caudatus]|uniref:Trafficking protein particle complex subunit 9-like isoform X2 n=1 Tax=Priapulus caudatus TaxID=37621 RepID=A0ABM1E9H7_PRICU|nr:PREDICTED: trafficking protein particle complex subunit 9-like isoform X2 [Priapulus caudatus]